jgi:replication-associated recombination protein RarA
MAKALLITGGPGTGKTSLVKLISQIFGEEKTSFLPPIKDERHIRFNWNTATKKTKLIVIEEIASESELSRYLQMIDEGVWIEKQCKDPFKINPRFIFTSNNEFALTIESVKRRVDLFRLKEVSNG